MDILVPLTENHEYKRVYARGKSAVRPALVLYCLRNKKVKQARVGITASKKIGNAVKRNRARRLLRESIRVLYPQLKPGDFCRGCGYCMPCPAGIEINQCARMSLMLRRAPSAAWLTPEWQAKMELIENCKHCGQCMKKCPYTLNTPELLRKNLEDYRTFLK